MPSPLHGGYSFPGRRRNIGGDAQFVNPEQAYKARLICSNVYIPNLHSRNHTILNHKGTKTQRKDEPSPWL